MAFVFFVEEKKEADKKNKMSVACSNLFAWLFHHVCCWMSKAANSAANNIKHTSSKSKSLSIKRFMTLNDAVFFATRLHQRYKSQPKEPVGTGSDKIL